VQENKDTVSFDFGEKIIRYTHDCYFTSKELWEAATPNDEIDFKGTRYVIRGKQDACNLERVFLFNLEEKL
jgi:hypothetical protein